MKKLVRGISLFLLLLAGSCGGSSGGLPFFGGVWSGALSLVEDTCGTVQFRYAFFNHLVNQDEFQMVLDNGALTFTGTVQSDTSFSVSLDRPYPQIVPDASCVETLSWRYEAIDEGQGTSGFVVRRSDITCVAPTGTTQCSFAFSGSGSRSSSDPFGPIPVDAPQEAEAGAVDAAGL